MVDSKKQIILNYLQNNPNRSSKEIYDGCDPDFSYPTLKRILNQLVGEKLVDVLGQGKGSKYLISRTYELFAPVNLDTYFEREIDERRIKDQYNLDLIRNVLTEADLFTTDEIEKLERLQQKFKKNISELTESESNLEMERLAIDLSWKSSQIEGNTYSLLETERLIKEKETAAGKTKDDAIMLLNHKDAIDFIVSQPDYVNPISVSRIEDIHSLLVKELGVDRNIRKRRVGISGTNYKPLDNEHQIKDALREMCDLINSRESVFEKALFALVLLSYIQAFSDGNKRTGRIISNAILIANGYCPISFRTIDSIEYKKAMLLFYEQNNITAFKQIFIDQFEFAVKTYF